MKKIMWHDKLTIDNGVVDNDHRFLLAIVNEFREKVGHFDSSDEAVKILEKLMRYSQNHFAREEGLQMEVNYEYRDVHHASHHKLIKQLEKLIEETQPSSGAYLNETMGAKIGEFLHDWLIEHVLKEDLRMKPYVKEMAAHSHKLDHLK